VATKKKKEDFLSPLEPAGDLVSFFFFSFITSFSASALRDLGCEFRFRGWPHGSLFPGEAHILGVEAHACGIIHDAFHDGSQDLVRNDLLFLN